MLSSLILHSLILHNLYKAYPEYIENLTVSELIWKDDARMPLHQALDANKPNHKINNPSLYDQLAAVRYISGKPKQPPDADPGRIRYDPFFMHIYGANAAEVEANLTILHWLPNYFGSKYPLAVTTINQVNQKLSHISAELEKLVQIHPTYLPFLANPGGAYNWRYIAHSQRLSMHSFGIAIDINMENSDYWLWDLQKKGLLISEDTELIYRNRIPWAIVEIFEKYGFIWGGKWQHYDTMHFEYRPELFL